MNPKLVINRATVVLCLLIAFGRSEFAVATEASLAVHEDLYEKALGQLQTALDEEQDFVKVHAAEALLGLGYDGNVSRVFNDELKKHGESPHYRIGIWRVLVRSTKDQSIRDEYLKKLRDVSLDPKDPDRITAAESLAKLQYKVLDEDRSRFEAFAQDPTAEGVHFYRWLLAEGNDRYLTSLAELLDSSNADVRGITPYALRHLANRLSPDIVAKLTTAADKEPESKYRVYSYIAAYVAARDDSRAAHYKELLQPYARSGSKDEKYQTAAALAVRSTADDIPLLTDLLEDRDADVRVSAANAILRTDRRRVMPTQIIDWLVLIGYALGLLSIGWYCSRRMRDTDDYLLAGRSMKPWAVGLSYFATLFSAISYLAIPGEMIRHGPLILTEVLAFPLVFLIVGYVMIPFIMRLRIVSAYEILEKRFGLSVRMLGSFMFLALRLIWMSVIVFTASQHILVPLLRLDKSATPWLAVAIGMLTVTYTSMGGFRAVIWTDVAQSFVLMFGAIFSIIMVNNRLGGPTAWWPTGWPADWDVPRFGFDPTIRVTMGTAVLAAFVWYISTAGSDQMTIQRYLATRDAPSARRMFAISLICNAFVWLLLAILGLVLFAYFKANPRLLPDGETLRSGADRMFPQYIIVGLPPGASGLVIAGLLSAAMGSLSSGLSSGCSVITEDWIERLRSQPLPEKVRLRVARAVSWAIGVVVVLLSFAATLIQGNLLERANKLVNLFTAPLFVLFFMAMFVPWATTFGTWAAALASVTVAIAVAQFDFLGMSFLMILPSSLAAGIIAGCLASLVPIGVRRPMLETDQALGDGAHYCSHWRMPHMIQTSSKIAQDAGSWLSADLSQIPTPALVLDAAKVRENIARLAKYAASVGINIRPHTKTHKSRFLSRLQMEAGAIGITIAKVSEAEQLSEPNQDVLLAYPPVGVSRADRLAALARDRTVRAAVDSLAAVKTASEAAQAAKVSVGLLVDLDVGMGRTGAESPAVALSLAQAIDKAPGLRLDGIMIYPGHIWQAADQQTAELQRVDDLISQTIELWAGHGLSASIVSGGSTPTAYQSHLITRLTEIRPGTYIFNDMNTVYGGYCKLDDCAARISATVISDAVAKQVVIDAGSKTLTSDQCISGPDSGYGFIVEYPDAIIRRLSEEHAQVDVSACSKKPAVGERVHVIPNHICPCVNLRDTVWWVEPNETPRQLKVDARGQIQ